MSTSRQCGGRPLTRHESQFAYSFCLWFCTSVDQVGNKVFKFWQRIEEVMWLLKQDPRPQALDFQNDEGAAGRLVVIILFREVPVTTLQAGSPVGGPIQSGNCQTVTC